MKARSLFQSGGPRRRVREDLVRTFMRRYRTGAARTGSKSSNDQAR